MSDTKTYATINGEFVEIVDEYVRSDDLTRMCVVKYVATGRRFDVEKSRLVFEN